MRIGKITSYFSPKSNANNFVNKQNLTSFGVEEQSKTQLLSKEAVTASRNKFTSNVSFSGYFRYVNVKPEGEYKDFDVKHSQYTQYGTGGSHLDYSYTQKETYWEGKSFLANINGKYEGSYSFVGDDMDDAVRSVIKDSDNFVENSEIRKMYHVDIDKKPTNPPCQNTCGKQTYEYSYYDPIEKRSCPTYNLYKEAWYGSKVKVYFTDPGEEVSKNIEDEANYIVYAPEPPKPEPKPEPIPELPKKKTLLQRIFG